MQVHEGIETCVCMYYLHSDHCSGTYTGTWLAYGMTYFPTTVLAHIDCYDIKADTYSCTMSHLIRQRLAYRTHAVDSEWHLAQLRGTAIGSNVCADLRSYYSTFDMQADLFWRLVCQKRLTKTARNDLMHALPGLVCDLTYLTWLDL